MSTKTSRGNEGQPSSPKKRVGRDETGSRFSKIKSSIFGGASKDERSEYSGPPSSYFKRNRTETDESEPAVYFREPAHSSRHQGQPWIQYRAPTPMPAFGSEEYYKVIKSNNPSPTTSNESELGSTPEHLSSGEVLFLPGPPDLPESPFPRRQANLTNSNPYGGQPIAPIPQLASYAHAFIPFQSISGLEQNNVNKDCSTIEMYDHEMASYQIPQAATTSQATIPGRPPIPRKVHGKTVSSGEDISSHRSKSVVHEVKRETGLNEEKLKELRAQLVGTVGSGGLVKSPIMQSDPVLFNQRTPDAPDFDSGNTNLPEQDDITLALIHDEMNARRKKQKNENIEHADKTPDETSPTPKSPLLRQASVDIELNNAGETNKE
jgi:hypothetical protein